MLNIHLEQLILTNFNQTPTASQAVLIRGIGEFIVSHQNDELLLVKGYAGTGKTSIVSVLVNVLKSLEINVVLMTPTGRSAKVLSTISNYPALTIHKTIYRQRSGGGHFDLNWNRCKDTMFIVDEASLIGNQDYEGSIFGTGRLLEDMFQFVSQGSNCKLVIAGDTAQLPPVGNTYSPALDRDVLQQFGWNVKEFVLTDVVRQELDSGILNNATVLRKLIDQHAEGQIYSSYLKPCSTDFFDITSETLLDEITSSYDHEGIDQTIILCRSNKRAWQYNKAVRQSILMREEALAKGDRLMVIKNNYFYADNIEELDFIANGDIVEVVKIGKYESLYGLNFINLIIRLSDYNDLEIDVKVILDVIDTEFPGFTKAQYESFYAQVLEDYAHITNKRKQYEEIRKNPYLNALIVKFAYAVTCHKSQGGQWSTVFIDEGFIKPELRDLDYLRWLYTAITRATQKVFVINFPKSVFKE